MAYPITTTAGITLATIADGTVNSTATSLTLIGKNYAGYGNFLNENYVKLLENFNNITAPSNAITGQLWFDSSVLILKVYDGTEWKPIACTTSSTTSPSNPVTGDMWWDVTNSQLKVWAGASWVTIGPSYSAAGGTSGVVTETILDSTSNSHIVVKFYVANSVIGIISKDTAFTPQVSIPGFPTVYPGFNLINSTTLTGSRFTGDVSNALSLQGVTASQFLRSDQNASTAYQITAGGGLVVGSDLIVTTSSGTEANITNQTLNKSLNFYVNSGGSIVRAIGISGTTSSITFGNAITVTGTASVAGAFTAQSTTTLQGVTTLQNTLQPNANGTINLGISSTRFANVYAGNFVGNLVGNVNGTILTGAQPNITSLGNIQMYSLGVGIPSTGIMGNVVATGIITQSYSDDRLKTQLGTIENALDKVDQLAGFYYQANETAQTFGYTTAREVGISAQATQKVLPEVTAPAPIGEDYLTIRYERFAPLFVEAIKELRQEVNAIKEEIAQIRTQ